MMSRETLPEIVVRTAAPEDAPVCGQICYEAFSAISAAHGFPCDFPGPEATTGMLSMLFASPGLYCVVAESGGRIVGSNVLDERSVMQGVGPITIDPSAQNLGVGRKLMQAVMDRANERGAAGIRLVQAGFHNRSLSLYALLGFDVREPLSCMQGRTRERSLPGCQVRPAKPATRRPAMLCHGEFTDTTEASTWLKPSNTALRAWWSAKAASQDTQPTWRSSAIPRRRRTWTCNPSLLRQNPSREREFLCPQETMFCSAGV